MIAFYNGKSFISRLIQWRTWSRRSHVAWVFRDGSVVEAWQGGVRRAKSIYAQHTPGTHIDLYEVSGMTDAQRYELETWLLEQVGKGYDYGAILGFALSKRRENPSRWFCSELIFAGLHRVGIDLLARVPAWKVSPGLLEYSPRLTPHAYARAHLGPAEVVPYSAMVASPIPS